MKKGFFTFAAVAVIAGLLIFNLSSCEKDEGKLPAISFKTGGSYTSADKTVASGDSVIIGIDAAKTEDKDVLKTFNVTKAVGSAAAVSVTGFPEQVATADEDAFSRDFTFVAGTSGTTETYAFTVINRDGLTNTISLKLTIQ